SQIHRSRWKGAVNAMTHFLSQQVELSRNWSAFLVILLTPAIALGQDKVQFREKGGKGIQITTGKIDAESIAGVKIGSRTISSGDIIDIQYEVPALIRLD